MATPVSTATYQFFCERVKYWAKELGVLNWKICTKHGGLKSKRSWAEVDMNVFDRVALIKLCDVVPPDPTEGEAEPDRHAFHEVCHLMLADLNLYAKRHVLAVEKGSATAIEEMVDGEVHGIVRRLENLMEDKFVKEEEYNTIKDKKDKKDKRVRWYALP